MELKIKVGKQIIKTKIQNSRPGKLKIILICTTAASTFSLFSIFHSFVWKSGF